MTSHPIFDTLLAETPEEQRPTFEPVISHQDFLATHHFDGWLQDLLAKARATHPGGLALATKTLATNATNRATNLATKRQMRIAKQITDDE